MTLVFWIAEMMRMAPWHRGQRKASMFQTRLSNAAHARRNDLRVGGMMASIGEGTGSAVAV